MTLNGERWSLTCIGSAAALVGGVYCLACNSKQPSLSSSFCDSEHARHYWNVLSKWLSGWFRPRDVIRGPVSGASATHENVSDATAKRADNPAPSILLCSNLGLEARRAESHYAMYTEFLRAPGNKCASCWLLKKHCCCEELALLPAIQLRPRVAVLMHYSELGRHLGSNTAKLLFSFGAEMLAWGVPDHMETLTQILSDDPTGTIVLFPGPGAVTAIDLAAGNARKSVATMDDRCPRQIVVLDGGWRECKKMNEAIDSSITRCVVTEARRAEYGGTRKYGGGAADADCNRVQTAAAFISLLHELGEDRTHVEVMKAGLASFMTAWESQIKRSKTWVT